MKFGWALILPVAVLLVGCTPTPPPTVAPPTPTFMCTPEAGGAETACTQQEFDKMKAKDEQYAEAEKVYRQFRDEYERVVRNGGASSLSAKLKAVIGDPALAGNLLNQLRLFKAQGLHIEGPGLEIKSVLRRPGVEMNSSSIAIEFCSDGSDTAVMKGKTKVRSGGIAKETAFFRNTQSGLQIVATTYKEVKTCNA